MAGVFEPLFGPQKMAICDKKVMELEAAREILAEVFGVRLSEVDEMIRSRFKAGDENRLRHQEGGLWPREFWVEG
jgi:hypothetical protein